MEKSLFHFDDYKAYLHAYLGSLPGKGRGVRRQMAEAMQCQTAYVSHVLAGARDFSVEQAEALTRLFGMREDEAEFFVLLVEFNRAGTQRLRQFFLRQLEQRRQIYQQLKSRVALKSLISPEDQAIYYSSWHYQAVRMAVTIPEFRTLPRLARRLQVSMEKLRQVIAFLLERGLIKENEGRYFTTDKQIHLPGDSPLVSKLHTNWRVHSLQSFDRPTAHDLHYSGVVTLAEEDLKKVREVFTNALLRSHDLIRPSAEEKLCVLNIDFYEL